MTSEENSIASYDEPNYPQQERAYDFYLRRMKELHQQVGGQHYK